MVRAIFMPGGGAGRLMIQRSLNDRLRVIATVQDPLAVQAILASLARSGAPAPPGPAPPAPAPIT